MAVFATWWLAGRLDTRRLFDLKWVLPLWFPHNGSFSKCQVYYVTFRFLLLMAVQHQQVNVFLNEAIKDEILVIFLLTL